MSLSCSYVLFDESMKKLKCMAQKFGAATVYENIHHIEGEKRYGRRNRQVYIPVGSVGDEKIYLGASVSPTSYKFELPSLLKGQKPGHLSSICVSDISDEKKMEFKKNFLERLNELETVLLHTCSRSFSGMR